LADERALPEQVSGLRKQKNRSLARYSPSELWAMQERKIFLKYCPETKIKAYHAMALDTSARSHELLNLKIKDLKERVIPATKDKDGNITREQLVIYQFMVTGKTGTRGLALTDSMSYVKAWLEEHPQKGNSDCLLFVNRVCKPLRPDILYKKYSQYYKQDYFPRLLDNPNVPNEYKEIIKTMLNERRWNPYVIRHGALTMKAKNKFMSDTMLRQHAGWAKTSNMPSVYFHNFGNESVDEINSSGYLSREDIALILIL
jgi:hypothetical protein